MRSRTFTICSAPAEVADAGTVRMGGGICQVLTPFGHSCMTHSVSTIHHAVGLLQTVSQFLFG